MSTCSKSKPRKRRVKPKDLYESLGPGRSETVRKKLENIQHYQPLTAREMKEKVKDLTERNKLKDWFDNDEGVHSDKVTVGLQVSAVPRGPTSTGSSAATTCCNRNQFELFCEWGMNCDVSLKVNNTIIKWDETELVEPHLEDLFSYNPASAVSSPPETIELPLGKSKKLNQLLDVIALYNERHSYDASSRNSKTFVQDALKALGIECPRILCLFEDYSERVKSLRSEGVPDNFTSPHALTHYIKHNLYRVSINPLDTEYLYFTCCRCLVASKHRGATTKREVGLELEYCLQDLESPICQIQADLIFNQYWFQLSGFQQH